MVDYFSWDMSNFTMPDCSNLFGADMFGVPDNSNAQSYLMLPFLNSAFSLSGNSEDLSFYVPPALNNNLLSPALSTDSLFLFNNNNMGNAGLGSNNLFNFNDNRSSFSNTNLFNFTNTRTNSNTGGYSRTVSRSGNNTSYTTIPVTNRGTVQLSGRTRSSSLGNDKKSVEVKPGVYINTYNYSNLSGLKQDMLDIMIKLDQKAKELGYTVVFSDCYRSHDQQADGYRRKPNLCAPPYKSAHEYGAAVDLVLFKNGRKVSVYDVPEFSNYAVSIGLEWGGTWKSKKEPWHFNIRNWKERADIAGEYRRLNNLA